MVAEIATSPREEDIISKRLKILLVEDEVITGSSLKMGLEEMGYDVCPLATQGARAYELALEERPDVILMDVNLPGGENGIQTAQRILREFETQILFLTGYHDDDVITQINAMNPLGYFVKPVSALRIRDLLKARLPH